MASSPRKIYEEFLDRSLDKNSAVILLISLIENVEDNEIRFDSIKILKKIEALDDRVFKLLENLLVSDSNEKIRNEACLYIQNHFLYKASAPMKWAIQHETDYNCTINIIKTLSMINDAESKSILINELNKIKIRKFIDDTKHYDNEKFKQSLMELQKIKRLEDLNTIELADIVVNYKTITALIKKFFKVHFEWENGVVVWLDLSELGWNADRTQYAGKLSDLSQIIGLKYLTSLKKLNLSNNKLSNIKELTILKNLTHLGLTNNQIEERNNIMYLKQLPNLLYADLSDNTIAYKIDKNDFGDTYIKTTKALDFLYDKL